MFKVSAMALCWISVGCVFLAACSSKAVTASDIVGIWVEKQAGGASGDTGNCAVFEFREDGTFSADNLPREYFIPTTTPNLPRVQASGTWTIENIRDTQFIDISIDPNQEWLFEVERHSTLYVVVDGAQRILYAWATDENKRIYFVKQATAACPD